MNILSFSQEQVKALSEQGIMNKKSVFHYRVCKMLAEGKKIPEVADALDLPDETVKKIKRRKCPDC